MPVAQPSDLDTRSAVDARPTASEETQRRLKETVCTALALGWQMAELYRERRLAEEAEPHAEGREHETSNNDLPGVGRLAASEKGRLRMAQIAHGLGRLAGTTGDKELAALRNDVQDGEDVEEQCGSGDLRDLHVRLLSALTVANYRLGKAYGLGRALCEATRPGQSDLELQNHLGDSHLTELISWCHDLKSVLPEHVGQAVAGSLARWQSWGRQRPWRAVERHDFDRRLNRQGQRWRAILTNEKDACDLLEPDTYLQAGEALLADAARVGLDFAKKFWPALLVAAVLLIGGFYVILVGGGSNVFAGLAGIAASLGITWKTATPTLSKLAGALSEPLWGAELDAAITVAVTDPVVPASSATPPSAGQPVPVDRATDPRTTRKAARQVWKRLDGGTRRRALVGRTPLRRLYYRYSGLWHGSSRAAYMPRDVYLSHVQSALENRLAGKRLETNARSRDELFSEFGPDDWEWIKTIVQAGLTLLEGKHDFGVKPHQCEMKERVRIVLVGDWGTGIPRAQALAQRIRATLDEVGAEEGGCERHLIHLGDVYYCGMPDEYRRRFIRDWPVPEPDYALSWNLNGNHDMYSGGTGYFGVMSNPASFGDRAERFAHQDSTSYFRLFNERWQIIGLDSAYLDNDLTPAQLPDFNEWLGLAPADQALATGFRLKGLMTWLRRRRSDPVPPPDGSPRTLLLTHHQLGSAMAQRSIGPGIFKKTAEARKHGRIDAWFWGHEHRCFEYKKYQGVACPVCIGNGGVPELLSHRFTLTGAFQALVNLVADVTALLHPRRWRVRAPRVKWQPTTAYEDTQGLRWEKLGFAVIDLYEDREEAWYVDEDGEKHKIASFGERSLENDNRNRRADR